MSRGPQELAGRTLSRQERVEQAGGRKVLVRRVTPSPPPKESVARRDPLGGGGVDSCASRLSLFQQRDGPTARGLGMSLEAGSEMVAAKVSSGELPVEGSERGLEGGGWEDLKGQRQVLRWQDMWGVCRVMDRHRLPGGVCEKRHDLPSCHSVSLERNEEKLARSGENHSVDRGRRALSGLGTGQQDSD